MVEKNDNYLREAYDHEQAIIDTAREEGFEKGIGEGIEKGIEKVIINMLNQNLEIEEIHKLTNIPMDKITLIKEELNN